MREKRANSNRQTRQKNFWTGVEVTLQVLQKILVIVQVSQLLFHDMLSVHAF
jgi:hypothetical protein